MSIPAGAVAHQRPGELVRASDDGRGCRYLLTGQHERSLAADNAQCRAPDELRIRHGNFSGATAFPVAATVQNWFLVSRVEVIAPESVGAIVAFGDSITDGARSTPDTNNRWPNHLARRLLASPRPMAVVNGGIGGNRVLSEGRFRPASMPWRGSIVMRWARQASRTSSSSRGSTTSATRARIRPRPPRT